MPDPDETRREDAGLSEAVAAAARRTTLGHLASGEAPSGHAVLAAMGGVRGLVESILPGLGFVLAFAITGSLPVSVGAPGVLALLLIVARLVQRQPVTSAVAGLFGVLLSAILALVTGKAANNFLLGFGIDAALVVVALVSIIARRPMIGVLAAALSGTGRDWREDPAKLRVSTIATWLWLGLGGIRLLVQVPIYLVALGDPSATSALGVTKLLMGVPIYAGVLWVSWLLVRSAFPFGATDDDPPENPGSGAAAANEVS